MLATRVQYQSGIVVSRKATFRAATVRCNVSFKPEQAVSALVAAGLLLTPAPAFANGPQGSDSASMEAELAKLIEARTGKSEALPELVDVPKGEVVVKAAKKAALAPVAVEAPVVAPMAPAVVEPPPPVAPAEPAPAALVKEAPSAGLQTRTDSTTAPAAGGSNGLLIGGAVAVLGVVAAAAMANNSGEQAPAAAAEPPAAAAPPAAVEGAAEGATAAASADGGSSPSA